MHSGRFGGGGGGEMWSCLALDGWIYGCCVDLCCLARVEVRGMGWGAALCLPVYLLAWARC
jgi:hypothetical protein